MISTLTLDRRRLRKDGRYPVIIKVGFGTGIYLGTGISCLEDEWSERAQLYSGPHAKMVNTSLSSKLRGAIETMVELQESGRLTRTSAADLRRILEGRTLDESARMDFEQVAEEWIASKKRAANSVTSIRQTIRQVRDYAGTVHLEGVDERWLFGLERHIGGKTNSIAVHMRNVKAVFNYAIGRGYTMNYPFRGYKIRTEATADRALSVDELRTLFSFPCDPWQQEYVDMFKLIFCFCGINVTDLAHLGSVRAGRIEYNRAKTGVHCSLAVQPEAAAIIKKYRGSERLLSILDRYQKHEDYLKHLNHALRTVGMRWRNGAKQTGEALFPDITSYWARHSWGTIAGEIDIPLDTIGAALGHSRGKSVTAIYVRTDMARKVDDANRKVLDYVLYGKDWRTGDKTARTVAARAGNDPM